MKEVLDLVKEFGLSLVIAIGALYALYKFFVFSIYEVKGQFSKYHEKNASDMEEVKKKIDIILEYIRKKQ